MSKTYLITLTPTGKFFFGGDMSFTVNDKETEFTSYIIRSNKFPQQTSLLGMLRFLILRNDKSLFDAQKQEIIDRKNAETLIGTKSFSPTGGENDFGVIKALHPCFLQTKKEDKWVDLRLKPKDKQYNVSFPDSIEQAIVNGKSVDIPESNYDVKGNYKAKYQIIGSDEEIEEEEIFKEAIANGINRDIHTGQTEKNSLFKTISYRLNDGFRFAFLVDIDLDKFKEYAGQVVSVGGDSSQFVIGIEKSESPADTNTEVERVVLTSPAYLTTEDLENVRFAITDTIPFRCMNTKTDDVKAYNKKGRLYDYSEKLQLYATGSIFYFGTRDHALDFLEKMKSHSDFYQIGYNHYQTTD